MIHTPLYPNLHRVKEEWTKLSHNRPLFGTRGSLILEIVISPYKITILLYFFSIFYSTGKTAAGDKNPAPPHPTPPIGQYRRKRQFTSAPAISLYGGYLHTATELKIHRNYIAHCGDYFWGHCTDFNISSRMTISFTHPIWHGANRIHLEFPPPHHRIPRPPGIAIVIINIWNGRGFRIAQVVRAVELGSFNLMVLTETKISIVAYFCNQFG